MTHTKEELEKMIQGMEKASSVFYAMAVSTGCHTFIEFTGLMNEYIKICSDAAKNGIDFTETSTHSGKSLPMEIHHIRYLAEKLDCIYGPTLRSSEALKQVFAE